MRNIVNGFLLKIYEAVFCSCFITYFVIIISTFFHYEFIKISSNPDLSNLLLTFSFIYISYLLLFILTTPTKYYYFVSYYNKNKYENTILCLDSKIDNNIFKPGSSLVMNEHHILKIKYIGKEKLFFKNNEEREKDFNNYIKNIFLS